jgi:hypothetical protein
MVSLSAPRARSTQWKRSEENNDKLDPKDNRIPKAHRAPDEISCCRPKTNTDVHLTVKN